MNRRGFLAGMAGILATGVAPAVIPSGILMPVRQLWTPTPISGASVVAWLEGNPIKGSYFGDQWSAREMDDLQKLGYPPMAWNTIWVSREELALAYPPKRAQFIAA